MDRLLQNRWDDPSSYDPAWQSRSEYMLALFDASVPDAPSARFSEYGCGPRAPFAAAVTATGDRLVRRYDRKRWCDECGLVDFNTGAVSEMTPTDVGVLSGVLEYLDDVPSTLALLGQHHRYGLISYAYWGETTGSEGIAALDRRCHKGGWRNHYTLNQIAEIASTFGVILRAGESLGQVVLLVSYDLRRGQS